MQIRRMSVVTALLALAAAARAQQADDFKTEYLKEFAQTSEHVLQLAEATPADKFGWRPGTGGRSISEVYVHIATGNYLLLALSGVKLPAEYYPNIKPAANGELDMKAVFHRTGELEKTVTQKDQVIQILKASFEAVRSQLEHTTPVDLDKPEKFFNEK